MQRSGATIISIFKHTPEELLDALGAWYELTFEPQTNGATMVSLRMATADALELQRLLNTARMTRVVLRYGIWRVVWKEVAVNVSIVETTSDGLILSGVVTDPLPRKWFLQVPLLEVYVYSRELERSQCFEHNF